MKPDLRLTWNGGFAIAYQIVGQGRSDLVYLPGYAANVDLMWDIPSYRSFLERLSAFSRLIVLDRRGVGCSDRLPPGQSATLEEVTDDVLAVMEAASSARATVFAVQESAFSAMLLAATHPFRVERLVLFGAAPAWLRSEDLPDEWTREQWDSNIRGLGRITSAAEFGEAFVRDSEPSLIGDVAGISALTSLIFNTNGAAAAAADTRMFSEVDLRQVLPAISAPTLVLRRRDDRVCAASSCRYLAAHIPRAEFVEVDGQDSLPWIGDFDPIVETIERFMGVEGLPNPVGRRLSSLLFTDIVDSSSRATEHGDAAWADLIARHHRIVRSQLAARGGREIDTAGDGFFATFDGPAQAVGCALAIAHAVRDLGIEIRAGVHTGEIETVAGKPGGAAVMIGSRIASAAEPSTVFVDQTVKDLTAGSGLEFEDAGERVLKGIPGPRHLYRVVDS